MDLNQVTVPCTDVPRSIDFYKKLGLIQIVDTPHYARFACPNGSSTFSIHLVDGPVVVGQTVVYFESNDLDAEVELLIQEGLEFDQMPQDQSWLWREARLHDPDGNLICLYFAGDNRLSPPWRIN